MEYNKEQEHRCRGEIVEKRSDGAFPLSYKIFFGRKFPKFKNHETLIVIGKIAGG
jgi:hypothetical protein